MTAHAEQLSKTVWPCLNYADAQAAIGFLTDAFGFVPTASYTADDDDSFVQHAEMLWPEGGGIMLGSARADGTEFERRPVGASSLYVVTDRPDELFERATKAGATLVRELRDEDYGSRGFSVADPEGNIWSFGTYRGHSGGAS